MVPAVGYPIPGPSLCCLVLSLNISNPPESEGREKK